MQLGLALILLGILILISTVYLIIRTDKKNRDYYVLSMQCCISVALIIFGIILWVNNVSLAIL